MKLLIIGKTGQLGSALINHAQQLNYEVIAPSHQEFDISNTDVFLNLIYKNPDVVINTAAFHNVPLCETEPLNAFKYNTIAVKNMAEISDDFDILFITFSTDYVFDGKKNIPYDEYEEPNPINIYGLSKLSGEYASLIYKNTIIIRTCGLYGLQGASSKGGNFIDNRIKDSKENNLLEIGNDQTVSPTYTEDLSKAVLQLIDCPLLKKQEIYHLVNEGYCTWYELTKETFDIMKINTKVIPVNRGGKFGNVRKPLFSALKNTKAKKLGIVLPHWKDALKRYLKTKYMKNKHRNES